jgi:hypothetical protein
MSRNAPGKSRRTVSPSGALEKAATVQLEKIMRHGVQGR